MEIIGSKGLNDSGRGRGAGASECLSIENFGAMKQLIPNLTSRVH